MKDIKNIFKQFEKKLINSSWFHDGWEIYNRGPYLQLYKTNWYNQNQAGIHFETFIESPQIREKSFPICLHAEEDCPHQEKFIATFLDVEKDQISNWKGYKTIGTGYQICQRILPLNFKNLDQRLYEEFNRLRQLEATIDKTLQIIENQ